MRQLDHLTKERVARKTARDRRVKNRGRCLSSVNQEWVGMRGDGADIV